MTDADFIHAPLEGPIRGFSTTRLGGVSSPPFDSFNLGSACGDDPNDDPDSLAENRRRLSKRLPALPAWLKQVHGNRVIHLDNWFDGIEADAAWTDRPGQVAAVLTADCLPLLVGARSGACAAVIHAGWRGLATGVIASCIEALPVRPDDLTVWIGPRICRRHYEVGEDVYQAFPDWSGQFTPSRAGHWFADLPAIASGQLRDAGVGKVIDSKACTADATRFFSYRHERVTGRMASLVWIEAVA